MLNCKMFDMLKHNAMFSWYESQICEHLRAVMLSKTECMFLPIKLMFKRNKLQ